MKKTLSLDQVEIYFDPETAIIELTSSDRRITGDRLKLAVSAHTESYRALLRLLVDEGIADLDEIELPRETLRIEDAKPLRSPKDSQTQLMIGRGLGNRPVTVDLRLNLLVAGGSGSGKSVIFRSVLGAGLEDSRVSIRAIDLQKIELGSYAYRDGDQLADTQEGALAMLQRLNSLLDERYSLLDGLKVNDYRDTDLQSIYLLIESLGSLTEIKGPGEKLWNARSVLISDLLGRIARLGRAAGIHTIIGIQNSREIAPELLANLYNQIIMGRTAPHEAKAIFGRASGYGSAYLEPRGRGILNSDGEQTIFHSYYIHYQAYRKPVDS